MTLHSSLTSRKQAGIADAVLLEGSEGKNKSIVAESTFLKNLETRFQQDTIYTYIGSVLISVNPFKPLDGMYGRDAVKMYRSKKMQEVPPHVYALTDDAYRDLVSMNRDQCIIITGESGAGKTEASKRIMEYIASISSSSTEVDRVKDVLLKSNPILEAFGNAKTNRNNNSSRFGKYMDIQFNFKGDPVGGHINNYLLEKSRVVSQAKGERNFHIMYYLIAAKVDTLKLNSKHEEYAYLAKSETFKAPGIDDKKEFDIMNAALKTVGFSQQEIQSLYRIVGGILELGNVEFDKERDVTKVSNINQLEKAANLFQVSFQEFQDALLKRSVVTQREAVKSILTIEQSYYAKDAIAKALYFKMFDFIVEKINQRIHFEEPNMNTKVIGVLDIYGFEVFASGNGFEQFCINYTNEKLQQLFINLTLKQEQEEYASEGIEWVHVEYFNNGIILELIENTKNGIIATLDEECMRPGNTTDKTFLEKLNSRHAQREGSSEYIETKELCRNDKQLTQESFRLKHYAGNVVYDINGFMDKNMDNLSRDLKELMIHSQNPVIAQLFKTLESNLKSMGSLTNLSNSNLARMGSTKKLNLGSTVSLNESTKRLISTATSFKQSLNELVNILLSKQPHYIRCIKPNESLKPGIFDNQLCTHQVRYLGLMENLRVKRAGFVFREIYEKFLDRYRVICPKTWPAYRGTAKEAVDVLLKHTGCSAEEYRLGKTKVFIRKPNTLFSLEDAREAALPKCQILIAKVYKGYIQRKKYKQLVAVFKILAFYRKYKSKRYFNELFKTFKDVKKSPDYGKRLVWPRVTEKALTQGAVNIRNIWRCWRAKQIISKIDKNEVDKIRLKVTTHTLFKNKKPFNLNRPFQGDYLNFNPPHSAAVKNKYLKFKSSHVKRQGETVLYSDLVQKCSRSGKPGLRYLVVSNERIWILKDNFTPVDVQSTENGVKKVWDLKLLESVTVTSHKDLVVVLKFKHDDGSGLDLILDFSPASVGSGNSLSENEKASEFVSILFQARIKRDPKNKLQVNVVDETISNIKLVSGLCNVKPQKGELVPQTGFARFKSESKLFKIYYADY